MITTILLMALLVALIVSYGLWLVIQLGERRRQVIQPEDDFTGRRIGG